MSNDPAVADQRDVLTRTHIPEDLLPDPPRFGDLLTPALDDLRVKDWHKLPPMGDRTPARYLAEIAHLPEVVKATEKAQKVDTRWKAIHGSYRKAVADRDEWIRTTRTEIQIDANKGGQKHGITKATAGRLADLDATVRRRDVIPTSPRRVRRYSGSSSASRRDYR